jgi:protein-tyrosine-phosphatase
VIVNWQVMKNEYGIDTSAHRSKLLSADDVANAYIVIPVKKDLGHSIATAFPVSSGKLKYFRQDVLDPWHQPYLVYQKCAHLIDSLLSDVVDEIVKGNQDL